MAVGVYQPQKKGSTLSQVLQTGGAIAGGIVGGMEAGPVGAFKGAGAGAGAGAALGGLVDQSGGQSSAISRRMGVSAQMPQAAPAEDPQKILQESMFALKQQPPEVQKQYGPTLQAAMLKLNRGQV